MARSASSSLWRSILGRVYSQHYGYPSTISRSSYGALLSGFRSMSTGATCKLFVGGLSWSTDENALRDAFSSYGDISEAKVVLDRETGRSRGFGFVSFVSIEDAESAKKGMDGNDISGRTVRVDFAIEKPRPFGGFGGG
eukprot:c1291_g1_i1 orf=179-595(+)